MATVVKSFAIQGVDGYTVDIESKVLDGQPMISIIGMRNTRKNTPDHKENVV